jgi:hypothetical protein
MRVIVRKERPHPAPSCGSPTSAGTASPASPPTPEPGSSQTWNYATAAAPAARTASGAPKTPACVTSRCTALTRTRSGANRWPWPANSWPGWRCWPWTAPPRLGTQTRAAAPAHRRRMAGARRAALTAPPPSGTLALCGCAARVAVGGVLPGHQAAPCHRGSCTSGALNSHDANPAALLRHALSPGIPDEDVGAAGRRRR